MNKDARKIAARLVKMQKRLRSDMLGELTEYSDDIESVFDPHSYSHLGEEIRDKYLTNLQMIQGILQELAHFNQGESRRPPVKVLSLRAASSDKLVKLVNATLARLAGTRVMDIEFVQNNENENWVALITYMTNPFNEEQDETAALM